VIARGKALGCILDLCIVGRRLGVGSSDDVLVEYGLGKDPGIAKEDRVWPEAGN
jgi:hypothetical protein